MSPPGDASMPPPGDASATPPGDASATPPRDASKTPPGGASKTPPGDACTSPPGDACTSPPGDACTSPPGDACTSTPGDVATMQPKVVLTPGAAFMLLESLGPEPQKRKPSATEHKGEVELPLPPSWPGAPLPSTPPELSLSLSEGLELGGEKQEPPRSPPGGEEQELPLPPLDEGTGRDADIPQQPLHKLLTGARQRPARPQLLRGGPAPPQQWPERPTPTRLCFT
ncbi:hypothetical protein EOD39_7735 [Acipenser ruthenus]|uniref:Uncharacterized protein n=1 Tax=Acipenser ruthenus TaxID=7906 RepID=A0A444U6B3_ACIRT|nr:hypothetical protein EOD39_7735 [Acipenser ruthenus]